MQQVECPAEPETAAQSEMASQYSPNEVEQRLYKWWEESGYFKPGGDETKQCFVIPMPPPNVTGRLHMGHAMFARPAGSKRDGPPRLAPQPATTARPLLSRARCHAKPNVCDVQVTLEDIMARFHRMRGRPTLWLPGTDHAGIATQMLVERDLRSQGIERRDLGREKFLERVWEWKAEYGGYITSQVCQTPRPPPPPPPSPPRAPAHPRARPQPASCTSCCCPRPCLVWQVRRLGASCDWSRERFTLEPSLCEAVNEAFVQLHAKGLIYRGDELAAPPRPQPRLSHRAPFALSGEYMVNWSPSLGTAVSDLEVSSPPLAAPRLIATISPPPHRRLTFFSAFEPGRLCGRGGKAVLL